MRNASQLIQALDAGSKNRLRIFRNSLRRDYDRRNFDYRVKDLLLRYVRPTWRGKLKRIMKYLWNLRSSKDGKLFSQGVKEYSKLRDNALAFAEPNHSYFGWNRYYKAALEEFKKEFVRLGLSPLTYSSDDDIRMSLPKLDTHAGFLAIQTGLKEKGENLENILERYNHEVQEAMVNGSFGKPILPAVRTQGNGHAFEEDGTFTHDCDHKTRMVSMIDMFVILAELRFARPIQDYMARTSWYAGGKEWEKQLSGLISGMRYWGRFWVSLDYSKFDQSISAWLIHDAFGIIKQAFPTLSSEDERLFEIIENDFIEKDFILADEIVHSVKGVPSGSMFTQIIDSIVNVLMIRTYLKSLDQPGQMIVMGDDNLVFTQRRLDVSDLAGYVHKNFGVTINSEKTEAGDASKPPTFLSSVWKPEGVYRSPEELIAKLLYPERQRDYESGNAEETEVLYSYVLMYRLGMGEFFDIARFLADYPNLRNTTIRLMSSRNLPGLMKYLVEYTRGFWSKPRPGAYERVVGKSDTGRSHDAAA